MNSEQPDYLTMQMLALGEVVQWSATMESTLRNAFSSLVGSKFAAVVAAGQSTGWLIEQCKALTDVHREMPEEHQASIKAALDRCRAASEQRNHLVHGVKTGIRVSDGALQTMRSRARKLFRKSRTGRRTLSMRQQERCCSRRRTWWRRCTPLSAHACW
jgi:hypothetical protein